MNVNQSQAGAPLLPGAMEAGADAETLAAIECIKDGHKQRARNREARSAASAARIKHIHAQAEQLRKLAADRKSQATWGLVGGIVSAAVSVVVGVTGGGAAAGGAAGNLTSTAINGINGMINGGKAEKIQADMKQQEAAAETAGESAARYGENAAAASKQINESLQMAQRFVDAQAKGDEEAQKA